MIAPAALTPRFDVKFYGEGDAHEYYLNGEETSSVTGVLSAEGLTDYEWCKEEHRNRGKAVHKIAQIISRDWRGSTVEEIVANSRWDPAATDPRLIGYGYGVAKFLLNSQFRPTLVEQPVGSLRLGLCGTLDAHGLLPSGAALLPDYKSGRPLPAAAIQMNLYAYMLEETFGIKTDLLSAVWVQAGGDYQMWAPRPAGGVDLSIGISAVNLYRWRKQNGML